MNILHDEVVIDQINGAQLAVAYNRIVARILEAGISNDTIGKGLMQGVDGVKAIALTPSKYFVVEVFEPEDGLRVFCVFGFIDSENDDIPGGQVKVFLQQKYTKEYRQSCVSDADLVAFARNYAGRSVALDSDNDKREPLPPCYYGWTRHADAGYILDEHDQDDVRAQAFMVRETKQWSVSFQGTEINEFYGELYGRLKEIFCLEDVVQLMEGSELCRRVGGEIGNGYYLLTLRGGWQFLCHYHWDAKLGGAGDGHEYSLRVLTLIDLWKGTAKKVEMCLENYENEYVKGGVRAFRFYPGKIFLDRNRDYENWKELEESKKPTCIEFSDEEMRILLGSERKSPVLINGSAGSGKSTSLYYLFVAYWLWYYKGFGKPESDCSGRPLFLTLSGTLLSSARNTVLNIIRFTTDVGSELTEKLVQERLAPCFSSFKDVLNVLLGDDSEEYNNSYEVDFELFKDLLVGSPDLDDAFEKYTFKMRLPKKYAPELCWHIIRCYIKGCPGRDFYDEGAFYDFLSQRRESNDRFIDDEACRYVWEVVWPWYRGITVESFSSKKPGLWDRQDMVGKALSIINASENKLPPGLNDIVAIFCDEAQDFTGIELRLIQQLSLLLKYKIQPEGCKELPFAFAGDPLQTLNPSGFRWEDLKRSMDENILGSSGTRYRTTPFQLKMNYRSPIDIVKWANMIQLARVMLFGENIRPQKPDMQRYSGDVFFVVRSGADTVAEKEADRLADSTILLPCSAGSLERFMDKYPILKDIKSKCGGTVTVLSVLDAKGLDISRVVLFAFGDYLFDETEFPLDTQHGCKDISVSYALNKVYVGLTRAVDQLEIIDTKIGVERFWRHIGFSSLRKDYLAALGDKGDSWAPLLPDKDIDAQGDVGIGFGGNKMTPDELMAEVVGWFENAYLQQSSRQMNVVAHRFERLHGGAVKKIVCDGFTYLFEKKYLKAAEQFNIASRQATTSEIEIGSRQINAKEMEIDCLWNAMTAESWRQLAELDGRLPGMKPYQKPMAEVLVSKKLTVDIAETFIELVARFFEEVKKTRQWEMCLEHVCSLVAMMQDSWNDLERGVWLDFANALIKCFESRSRFRFCGKAILDIFIHFAGGEKGTKRADENLWQRAYEFIDKNDDIEDRADECDRVRARCAPWPDYVQCALGVGESDVCVNRWMVEHQQGDELRLLEKTSKVRSDFIETLFRVASSSKRSDADKLAIRREAVRVALELKNLGPIVSRLESQVDLIDLNQAQRGLFLLLDNTIRPEWEDAAQLFVAIINANPSRDAVNCLLRSVAKVRESNLKKIGAEVFVDKLEGALLNRSTLTYWPKDGNDLKLAAQVFKLIGLDKKARKFARNVVKNIKLAENRQVRDVAGELYIYASKNVVLHENDEREKKRAQHEFIEDFLRKDPEDMLAISTFNAYWDSASEIRFQDGSKESSCMAGHNCVRGLKLIEDEDTDSFKGERLPFRFIETETKVTIKRMSGKSEWIDKAVIMKADWRNEVDNLSSINLVNAGSSGPVALQGSYRRLQVGVRIELPEWRDLGPVDLVFE